MVNLFFANISAYIQNWKCTFYKDARKFRAFYVFFSLSTPALDVKTWPTKNIDKFMVAIS